MGKQKKSFFCHTVLCNRLYLHVLFNRLPMLLLSAERQHVRGKVEKPRKHKMRTFRDRDIVLSKEFGCEDRCSFFYLFQLIMKQNTSIAIVAILATLQT